MKKYALDDVFELWARWVRNGCTANGGQVSVWEMLTTVRCKSANRGGGPGDLIESSIENAVNQLAESDAVAAVVVRVEYGAMEVDGTGKMVHRDKANALSLTLRQYRRKLAKARAYVYDFLLEKWS